MLIPIRVDKLNLQGEVLDTFIHKEVEIKDISSNELYEAYADIHAELPKIDKELYYHVYAVSCD